MWNSSKCRYAAEGMECLFSPARLPIHVDRRTKRTGDNGGQSARTVLWLFVPLPGRNRLGLINRLNMHDKAQKQSNNRINRNYTLFS